MHSVFGTGGDGFLKLTLTRTLNPNPNPNPTFLLAGCESEQVYKFNIGNIVLYFVRKLQIHILQYLKLYARVQITKIKTLSKIHADDRHMVIRPGLLTGV